MINLKEIIRYKFFCFSLFIETLAYIQTNGTRSIWQILNPLIQSGVFSLVFGEFAKIPTNGVPPFLFYSSAMVGWVLFHSSF